MTDITQIPLGKLVASEGPQDSRDGRGRAGTRGVCRARIAAIARGPPAPQGQVRGRCRRPASGGAAASRRTGQDRGDLAVPCQVRDGGDAAELGLAENVLRELTLHQAPRGIRAALGGRPGEVRRPLR
jgi:hypothetical protein